MRFCFVLLLLLFLTPAHAQVGEETRKAQILEQTIELIGESLGQEDIDLTTVFDQLSYYYDNPINLNKTSREELQELYLLSEIQITNLLMHIERNGKFLSIYELQAVPGFDLQIIRAILPFVKIADRFDAPHADWKTLMRDGQNELFLRWTRTLEPQAGFAPISDSLLALKPNSRYLGSPDRLYMRYRYRFGNKISFGITGEKDPGEEFFKGTQKNGFDFYSAHFLIRDIGPLKTLAIGDYQVSFGQGLTFATGLALGKTANSLNVKRSSTAIRPYTSVDENQFMRGAAATMKFGKIEFTGFVSRNRVDANRILVVDTSQVNDEGFVVSSLQTSGIHATPAELEDKGALLLSHYGGHTAWKTKRTNIGATAVYSTLSTELEKNITYLNQFDFTGKSNLVTGLDFNHIWRNFNFFGEFSRSVNGGMAMQSGILASLDPKFSLVFLYRNYQKNYQSLFANALAEGSRPVNEKGLYIGAELRPNPNWMINVYFDSFESNWLRSGVTGPMRGYEFLGQIQWRPNKKLDMYFRVRTRTKPGNDPNDPEAIDVLLDKEQNNFRYQFSYKASDAITLRSRFEWMDVGYSNQEKEKGYVIYQDVVWKPMSSPLSLTARYALFDTDSYNSRIYAYENDVLYVFSIPAYYYRGSRFYGILRYQYKKRFDIWLRYAQFLYNNRTSVGSGMNEIEGNRKSEVRIQIRFSF